MQRCSTLKRLSIPCLMLVGTSALAQTTAPAQPAAAAPPAAPAAAAAPAAPVAEPQAAAPAAAAAPVEPAPAMAPPAPVHEPMFRVRAGADGAPALFVPGISYGVNFSGRIGVQIKRMWGAYLDVGGGFGLGGSISAGTGGGGVSINVADYWRLGFMGEVDLGRYFFLSLGPGVCGCTWGGVDQVASSTGGASQAAFVSSGYFPMILSRIGVGIGRGRNKFTIALENMVTFGKMTQVSQNASMSGANQSVAIGNLAVGWAPGLMFGWDMR